MKKLNRQLVRIYRMHIVNSLVLLFLLTYLISFLFGIFSLFIEYSIIIPIDQRHGALYYVVVGTIIAPIVETLFFQYFIYKWLTIKMGGKVLCVSLISGAIFGLVHFTSVSTILHIGSIGVVWQLWFILLQRRYGIKKAFGSIAGVHALRNTISTVCLLGTGVIN